jgi:hypothetical protein
MNISKFFNDGVKNVKSDSNLKQILMLASLAVIVLGFGNKNLLNPRQGFAGQAMGLEQFGSQETGGHESGMNNEDLAYKKKRHRHHHRERENKNFDHKAEVGYDNAGPAPQDNINSPEVPYTVE